MGSLTTYRYVKAGRYNEYSWFSSFMFILKKKKKNTLIIQFSASYIN